MYGYSYSLSDSQMLSMKNVIDKKGKIVSWIVELVIGVVSGVVSGIISGEIGTGWLNGPGTYSIRRRRRDPTGDGCEW